MGACVHLERDELTASTVFWMAVPATATYSALGPGGRRASGMSRVLHSTQSLETVHSERYCVGAFTSSLKLGVFERHVPALHFIATAARLTLMFTLAVLCEYFLIAVAWQLTNKLSLRICVCACVSVYVYMCLCVCVCMCVLYDRW